MMTLFYFIFWVEYPFKCFKHRLQATVTQDKLQSGPRGLWTILQDVNNTGPETVCNCFLYFTCKENILKMFV